MPLSYGSVRSQTGADGRRLAAGKGFVKVEIEQPLLVREVDALRLTGLKRTTFRKLMSDGEFASFKVGNARVFSVASIHDWIRRELKAQGGGQTGFRDAA